MAEQRRKSFAEMLAELTGKTHVIQIEATGLDEAMDRKLAERDRAAAIEDRRNWQ